MTIKHSVLTGSALHEPKGIASANANEVYIANGTGSGAHTKLRLEDHVNTAAAPNGDSRFVSDGAGSGSWEANAGGCLYLTSTGATTGMSASFQKVNVATLGGGIAWTEQEAFNMITNVTDGYYQAAHAGKYFININIALEGTVAAVNEFQFTIGIDPDPYGSLSTKEAITTSYHTVTTTDKSSVALTCMPTLAVGDRIYLMVRRNSGSAEVIFTHINFVTAKVS